MENEKTPIPLSTDECEKAVGDKLGQSFDLLIRRCKIQSTNGVFFLIDGMCDEIKLIQSVIGPLTDKHFLVEPGSTVNEKIKSVFYKGGGITEKHTIEELTADVLSGCAVLVT